LATCQILDANSAGKHAANLAFDDKAKTVPNTIGWKPIPRSRWWVARQSPLHAPYRKIHYLKILLQKNRAPPAGGAQKEAKRATSSSAS
jgi:hypothetical protein